MKLWKYVFGFLTLTLLAVVIAIAQFPDSNLHIVACDVGQGDAILITYKETQILTDGGPDSRVLECLGRHMPFYDREIELVILTHPDSDHATGLVSVLQGYEVDKILLNPTDPGTQVYKALVFEVGGRGVGVIEPTLGMQLRLGLIYLDILSEYDDKTPDTNTNSIVYKLRFNRFSSLFFGDIPSEVSDYLSGKIGKVNYIKIPHHGSINGLTENLLKSTMPEIAVISVGKNPWGFPKPEILEMLGKYNAQVLRTDQLGDVEVVTDGSAYWVK